MASQPEVSVPSAKPQVATMSGIAGASLGVFIALLALLHVLRADLNPVMHFVSEYAVGDYGFLMIIALLAMGVASIALVAVLRNSVRNEAQSRTGLILIGIWGVGMVPLAVFPIGVGETVDSTADVIHRLTALIVFLTVSIGVLLVSRGFRRDATWQQLAKPAIVLSILLLVGYVATFGGYALDSGFEGLSQRFFLLVLVVWMGLVIWRCSAPRTGRATAA